MLQLKRIGQILDGYCAPATLAILYSQYGFHVDQADIVKKANARTFIDKHGMRLDQMSRAVRTITPHLSLFAKRNATLEDLDVLINTYNFAVGVEWQGIFEYDTVPGAPKVEPGDDGHCSVIVGIDLKERRLFLQDPSEGYEDKNREFDLEVFAKRWFDTNDVEVNDPDEAKEWKQDNQVLFVLAPRHMSFPEAMGLKKVRVAPIFRKKSIWEKTIGVCWKKTRHIIAQIASTLYSPTRNEFGFQETEADTSL